MNCVERITPIVKLSLVYAIIVDAYIVVSGTITITGAGDNAAARQADERNKVIQLNSRGFKICSNYMSFRIIGVQIISATF